MENTLSTIFFSLANKYGWGRLAFMLKTSAGTKKIFRQEDNIQITDIHHKSYGYLGLPGIGNIGNNVLKKPLVLSVLKKLDGSANKLKLSMTGYAQILYQRQLRVQLKYLSQET